MRGSIRRRAKGSWTLVFDVGRGPDGRRKQQLLTVQGTRKQAEARLTEVLRATNRHEFVAPSKMTLGEWLSEWVEKAIRPPARKANTYDRYKLVLTKHLVPALGAIPLQSLKAVDLSQYYAALIGKGLSSSTAAQHHAILSGALKAAELEGLVVRNVAKIVVGKPQQRHDPEAVRENCWTADEARAFLTAAEAIGAQPSALFALALDTGARKGELCGLRWADVDLVRATVTFSRQLLKPGREPVFGALKRERPRMVDIAPETLARLKTHRRTQAELKLRNRTVYHDLGLVFAKEWGDLYGREDSLGLPLQSNNLGQREYARVITAASVKRITFHGLRHTSATLLLSDGEPVHVVSARLGHKDITTTLRVYAHVLPTHGQAAARRLSGALYGVRDQSVINSADEGVEDPTKSGGSDEWCGREDWAGRVLSSARK